MEKPNNNGKEQLVVAPVIDDAIIERVLLSGDLEKLNPKERVNYYTNCCESLGLNPTTRPFEYIKLNGKTVLYAKRECTEQLRKLHGVSIRITDRKIAMDMIIVTAQATDAQGRVDESVGVVPAYGKGADLANDFMKCETKAKRRVTLSICGLGMLDESEMDTIDGAEVVKFDDELLGEAVDQSSQFLPEDEDQDEEQPNPYTSAAPKPKKPKAKKAAPKKASNDGGGEDSYASVLKAAVDACPGGQGELAELIGVSVGNLAKVMYGQSDPYGRDVNTVLADYLEIDGDLLEELAREER